MLAILAMCALPDNATLADDVRAAMAAFRVPSVAVVVVDGPKSIARGYGVTADTLFSLGSCGKAFTSAALASMVADGKLSWDDRVSKHLDGFKLSDPLASRDVTIRDLLCHRTGLAGHEPLWYRSPFSSAEAVRRAGLLPLTHGFRTSFVYQSTMVTAAGLVAARADGRPWADVVRARLLEPLKMKATFLDTASAEKGGPLAGTYALDVTGKVIAMPPHRWAEGDAAGSVYSSANDLVPWLRFQLSGDARIAETHTPQIVLRDTSADRLIFPRTVQRSYGLGWVIYDHRGHKLVAHGGALDGHRCHIALAPGKGGGVAVLSNLHQTSLNAALAARLMDRLLGHEPDDWNAAFLASAKVQAEGRTAARRKLLEAATTGAPQPPGPYAGAFNHAAYGDVKVTLKGDNLVWRWRDEAVVLEPLGASTFLLRSAIVGEAVVGFAGTDGFTVSALPGTVFRRGTSP